MRPYIPALLMLPLVLDGCRSHYAQVSAYTTPGAATLLKTDAIAVGPIRAESIREQQFAGDIREQLCRFGYKKIVEADQAPRWMLRYSLDTEMANVGYQTKPGGLPFTQYTT